MEKYIGMVKGWFQLNIEYFNLLKESSKLSKPINIPINELHDTVLQTSNPIFVLSTGRAGTKLLTKIFETSSNHVVAHAPNPEMSYYSKFAFENQTKINELKLIFNSARYEALRNCFLLKKQYIETNPKITFFAEPISQILPNAQFIHVYRDIISFIESGIGRKWYINNDLNDEGRIVASPWPDNIKDDQILKIAWLWIATNLYIHQFSLRHPDKIRRISSSDLFKKTDLITEIVNGLTLDKISSKKIAELIKTPVNKQPAAKKKNLSPAQRDKVFTFLKNFDIPSYLLTQ